jgi:hypothetical protein
MGNSGREFFLVNSEERTAERQSFGNGLRSCEISENVAREFEFDVRKGRGLVGISKASRRP